MVGSDGAGFNGWIGPKIKGVIGALNKKLLRDLWKIKGQMAAIVMVMASGIAAFIVSFSVLDSLELSRDIYYERTQFADVFSHLKRAPEAVKEQILEIPGVSVAQTRVAFDVTVQVEGMMEPATGRLLSLPDSGKPLLNNLFLRQGRFLAPDEDDAVLASEAFVLAHGFELGETVRMIINGHQRDLQIVGVVLSPEYVYSLGPGALFPDDKRFGIFWMGRHALEAAVDMDGAFNDLSIRLARGASVENVKTAVDRVLKPYGGLLSYGRDMQLSNWFLTHEIEELEGMGLFAPLIFLGVAAFLINVVMTRLVATQREQIGMIKAIGYSDVEIASHFLKMVLFLVVLGSLIGVAAGSWLGAGMTRIYIQFFHFPIFNYVFAADVSIFAIFFCAAAAVAGSLIALRQVVMLPPAEAMRPESPARFRKTLLERLKVEQFFSTSSRIVLRQLERRPIRAAFSALGIGLAMSILIFGLFMEDSINALMKTHFDMTQRQDVSMNFASPRETKALEEIRLMPGILRAEPFRSVPAELKYGHHNKRASITGLIDEPELSRILDENLNPLTVPDKGVVLSRKLAELLYIQVGDIVQADVLEDRRPTLYLPVVGIIDEFIGLGAYMNLSRLNYHMNEGPVISGVALMADPLWNAMLYQNVKEIPSIASIAIMSKAREIFKEIMAETIMIMVTMNMFFAALISFGVIYNTARIAFSERARELSMLRVLGMTRPEVAYILFGELAVVTLVAIPMGLVIGFWMVAGMVQAMNSELFRIPLVIENSTYGYSIVTILASALFSFYLVWRQVDQIDLVSAQKGVD